MMVTPGNARLDGARQAARSLVSAIRARDWWAHKLAPMLGTGYATAFVLHDPLLQLWPTLLLTMVAVAAAASYVSLINDLTDVADDRSAGKPNRLDGRPPGYAALAIVASVVVGAASAFVLWRGDVLALVLYGGSWIAFSMYSVPPLRLKVRGFPGALADAAGAHLFPQLLVTVTVFAWRDNPINLSWTVAVAVWALMHGLRGAVWHQLSDLWADRRTGVLTFASRCPEFAELLVTYVMFPAELLALGYLLWRTRSLLVIGVLPILLVSEQVRSRTFGWSVLVVRSDCLHRHAMHEYYVVGFPMSFLIADAWNLPLLGVVLVLHVWLFREASLLIARELVATMAQVSPVRSLATEVTSVERLTERALEVEAGGELRCASATDDSAGVVIARSLAVHRYRSQERARSSRGDVTVNTPR